jgi:hypothetical protein
VSSITLFVPIYAVPVSQESVQIIGREWWIFMSREFFHNRIIGHRVTIDVDMFIEDWEQSQRDTAKAKICQMEHRFNTLIHSWYRRSSSNNVHILLEFEHSLPMLDIFLIRAFMKDDPVRLILDMHRYFRTEDVDKMNRCFDEKIHITEGVKKAGDWIPLKEAGVFFATPIERSVA